MSRVILKCTESVAVDLDLSPDMTDDEILEKAVESVENGNGTYETTHYGLWELDGQEHSSFVRMLNFVSNKLFGGDYETVYRDKIEKGEELDFSSKVLINMPPVSKPEDLLELIRIHYRCYDVEFTTGYLEDIRIKMTGNELLQAYRDMQDEFNGDTVFMLSDACIFKKGNEETVSGTYDDIHGFPGVVEGDAGDLLREICDLSKNLYRFDEYEVEEIDHGRRFIKGTINPLYL